MRLVVRLLGLDLLDVDLSTNSPSPEPDDYSRDLSGGTHGLDADGLRCAHGEAARDRRARPGLVIAWPT